MSPLALPVFSGSIQTESTAAAVMSAAMYYVQALVCPQALRIFCDGGIHAPRCLLDALEQIVESGVTITSTSDAQFTPAIIQPRALKLGDLVFIDKINQVGCVIWMS